MAVGFLLVPFLVRHLGKEAFGLTALAETTILMCEIFTVSIRQALSRHVTFAMAKGDEQSVTEYLSTGRFILFFSAAIVLAVGVFIGFRFDSYFNVPGHLAEESRRLFILIVLGFTAPIPNIVFWTVLYAKQRYDLINAATGAAVVVRALAVFILFSILPSQLASLTVYGLVYWITMLCENFVIYFLYRKLAPTLRIHWRHFNGSKIRDILSFGLHTSISRLSGILAGNLINVLVNVNWGASLNAVYAVAQRFLAPLNRIFSEPTWTLTPTFTDLAGRGDKAKVEQLLFTYSKALMIAWVPVCFFGMLAGQDLMRLWVGNDFDESGRLMVLYLVSMLTGVPFATCGCITTAYGKVKWPSLFGLVMALLNVMTGFWLAKRYDIGLFGFAYSNILFGLIGGTFFLPYYACRVASLSLSRYWVEAIIKPLSLAVPLFVLAEAASRAANFSDGINAPYLMVYGVASAIYYAGAFYWILDSTEKRLTMDLAGPFRPILKLLSGNLSVS